MQNDIRMLKQIDKDIWVAEQPLRYFGLSIGTRMTVVRLRDGGLAVISPIRVSEAITTQLNDIGTVKHIIAPNLYHYLFATDFNTLYPNATFWAVPGLASKRPDLPIDRVITPDEHSPWPGLEFLFLNGFRTLSLSGFDSLNECVFFHLSSRTLILTDAAFHFDESFPFVTKLAIRIGGGYESLSPSLPEQIATTAKDEVRQSITQILEWDFERVIMAHGSIIENGGKQDLKRGYEKFLGGDSL